VLPAPSLRCLLRRRRLQPEPVSDYLSYRRHYLPDLDGDGVPEFLAYHEFRDEAAVLSGMDGMILWNVVLNPDERVVGLCGDFDGDGVVDFYTMTVESSLD